MAVALACFATATACLAQPDLTLSYYVPQSGPVGAPSEGASATRFFYQCPNNDVPALINSSARVKVVLLDALGAPVVGWPAADLYILLNGGTAAQGFFGTGADSIIANSLWNPNPLCPDVRVIQADAPTDAAGATYITFAGPTPGLPGVATRDPGRKWGHYDSELRVFVSGIPLAGRLTTLSPNGSYVLRIKNLDVVDGLAATLDAGEYVSFRDFNVITRELNSSSTLTYWLDFNGDGLVNSLDFNVMAQHYGHDCTHPNNP